MAGELPPVVGSLQLSIDDFIAKLDEAKQKLADFSDTTGEAKVSLDTGEADAKLDDLKERIDSVDSAHGEASVGADTGEADTHLEDIQAKLYEINSSGALVTVGADTEEADEKLDELEAKKTAITEGQSNVRVGANTSEADSSLSETTTKMLQFGALAPGVATMVGGAFAALPGILSGVGAGFGSLLMGIHNISAAIDAYKQVASTASQTGNEMAQIALSNAQTLANAAAQVESAGVQLSQAQMSSYDQVHQAQEQVIQSTQQLEAAQFAQRSAQVALTEATMQAKFQLQDYQTQIADMGLQIKAAIVAQQQAQLSLAETMGDPAATQLQREQAQITYQQATQQITDLQVQYKQLQETAAYQTAKGVQGSDAVVQAQQQVTEANYGVKNAQVAAADAQLYLNQAQIEAAQNLTQAERQLNMALYDQSVAIKQVALTMAQPIGAYSQLQQALAMLSPAGQSFVEWWHSSMTPIFQQMYASDQANLLPGLQKVLTTLQPYFLALIPIIDQFAQGFVKAAGPIATFLSSAQGIKELQTTMSAGLGFMQSMGGAILDVMKGLGSLGVVGAPAVKVIGQAIQGAAQMFMQWAASPAAKQLVADFVNLMNAIGQVVDKVGGLGTIAAILTLIKGPMALLVAFIPQLMPLAVPFLNLAGALMKIVEVAVTPVISAIVVVLLDLMNAATPLLPVIAGFAKTLGNVLGNAITQLAPILASLIPPLVQIFGVIFRDLTPVIGPLMTAFISLVAPIMQVVQAILRALMPVINELAPIVVELVVHGVIPLLYAIIPLVPIFGQLVLAVIPLLPPLLQIVQMLLPPLLQLLHDMIPFIQQVAASFGGNLISALNTVVPMLKSVAGFIHDIMVDGASVGNVIAKMFSGKSGGILGTVMGGIGHILGFAEGGIVNKPTLAVVGEGGGPEAILPLNNPARMAQILATVPQGVIPGSGMVGVSGGGGPTGTTPNQQINVYAQTNANPQQIGNEVGWALRTAVK